MKDYTDQEYLDALVEVVFNNVPEILGMLKNSPPWAERFARRVEGTKVKRS